MYKKIELLEQMKKEKFQRKTKRLLTKRKVLVSLQILGQEYPKSSQKCSFCTCNSMSFKMIIKI